MTNKVLREKSNFVVCQSSKSRFLKQKIISAITNRQIVFPNYKNKHMYCKNCKKHTGNMFPKTLIPISQNKIKGKSKCATCLTERTFIHEIKDKYNLESELEIYLQVFTD